MQLRCLRHTVRHTTTGGVPSRDTTRHDEHAAIRVGIERRLCLPHEKDLRLDIDGIAGVPVIDRWGIDIREGGEASVAL